MADEAVSASQPAVEGQPAVNGDSGEEKQKRVPRRCTFEQFHYYYYYCYYIIIIYFYFYLFFVFLS